MHIAINYIRGLGYATMGVMINENVPLGPNEIGLVTDEIGAVLTGKDGLCRVVSDDEVKEYTEARNKVIDGTKPLPHAMRHKALGPRNPSHPAHPSNVKGREDRIARLKDELRNLESMSAEQGVVVAEPDAEMPKKTRTRRGENAE